MSKMKKVFFWVAAISVIVFSHPQQTLALWAKAFGTSWLEYGVLSWPTEGGGYYVWSQSSDPAGTGKKYLLLSKLNASGDIQWSKKIYAGDYDNLSIFELDDGKFFVQGTTKTSSTAATDALWAKFSVNSSTGNFTPVFQKVFRGSGDDSLGFGLDEDGEIAVGTGMTNSFSGDPNDLDMVLVKINSTNGTVEWSKVYHHSVKDQGASLMEVSGGYMLCSNVANTDYSRQDILVAKLDSSGNVQWAKLYGGTLINMATMRQMSGGNFLLIGAIKANNATQYTDTILIKINGSGNILWAKKYAGNGTEGPYPFNIVENGDGTFILNGYIMNSATMRWHPFVMKLTSTGGIVWKTRFAIGDNDTIGFSRRSDGTFYASGVTSNFSSAPFDPGNIVFGRFDANFNKVWLRKFGGSGFESGGFFEADGQSRIFGTTGSFGVGASDSPSAMAASGLAMDALGIILNSDGTFPGCPYITDISYGESIPSITASDLGWTPTTTSLTSRGTLSATSIALTIENTTVTATDICTGGPPINQPDITVIPETVTFGSVNTGMTQQQTVTIRNDGQADLSIGTISSPSSPFSKGTDNCSNKVLHAGETCSVTYAFSPAAVGTFNANSNIASNDPDENPKTLILTGQGVQQTIGISLQSPLNGQEFWSCYTELPTFKWTSNGNFNSVEVQFSTQSDFSSNILKVRASDRSGDGEVQVNSSTWKKILTLPGLEGGTVYWRVMGKATGKETIYSNTFSVVIVAPQHVANPIISSTSISGGPPTLFWANQCNVKFKVWFGNRSDFDEPSVKKKAYSFNIRDPFANGGVFTKTLTSGQWNAIRNLVGNALSGQVFWFVEAWDGIRRYSQTEVMSFKLTP